MISTFRIQLLNKWEEKNGRYATNRELAKCLYEAEALQALDVLCSELSAPLTHLPSQGIGLAICSHLKNALRLTTQLQFAKDPW